MSEIDKLYQLLERTQELGRQLAQEADDLHCPDHCSGNGFCAKCQLESDLELIWQDEKNLLEAIERLEKGSKENG